MPYVAVGKKCNAERFLMIMHKDYISKYPDNSKLRTHAAQDLKHNSRSRQAIFYKLINKAKAVSYTSQKKLG